MSQLAKLVEFLDRDDVTEVVIATGRPVTLRLGGEYRALGRAAVTHAQIAALFAGSPLESMVAAGGGVGDRLPVAGREVAADVQTHGEHLLVRLGRPRAASPARAPSPAASPAPSAPASAAPRSPAPPAAPPLAAGSGDSFDELLSRSSDGGARAVAPPGPPIGVRKKPITMPPGLGAAVAGEPVVERSDAPVTSSTTARHAIDLPPADPGALPDIMPTSAAPPRRARAEAAPPSPARTASAPPAVAPAPAPAPSPDSSPPAPAGPFTPSRRHTVTASQLHQPLPPLTAGKAQPSRELLAILAAARNRQASDVHLSGDRPPMERSPHGLQAAGAPLSAADVERLLTSLLTPGQRAQLDARGYVDAAFDVDGAGRLRANVSRFRGGVKGSFRLVASTPPSFEQLGLPRELARVVTYHQGLVVVAGPGGHGKSTTLAALVDLVNTHKAHHIITIEDPVEIIHPRKRSLISQREVGLHTRSFGAALRASLREDPDVIVIGELRDRETVEIALTAAETGHLVMATMSTPSAAKTLDRLIDMFPPDDQAQVRTSLAAALRFVVAQRLLPAADGQGAVAAAELLTGVLPLASLIRDNKLFQVPSLQQRGRSFGMIRLDDSLIELVRAGRITEDVALRVAESKRDLSAAVRGPQPAAAPARAPEPRKGLGGIFGAGRRSE